MAEDEIGTLGPKEKAGIRVKPNWNATALPAKGVPVVSRPDLVLPAGTELDKEKLFPVRMLKSYRPMSSHFQIGDEVTDDDGKVSVIYRDPPVVEEGQDAGFVLRIEEQQPALLPISEAKAVMKRGIAERNDEIAA